MPTRSSVTTAAIGDVFGRLTVIGYEKRDKLNRVPRSCQCECGRRVVVLAGSLRSGLTRSCGCLALDVLAKRNAGRPKQYPNGCPPGRASWRTMIDRCENPDSKDFPRYGKRGIKVCDRWRKSFENFLADMGPKPSGMTIDRIDTNGNYEPGNCRWATPITQGNNRRDNVKIVHDGIALTSPQWARLAGIKPGTLDKRLRRGIPIAEALAMPVGPYRRRIRGEAKG